MTNQTLNIDFVYLHSISREKIKSFEDVMKDRRLIKFLWIELILNPGMVKACELQKENPVVKISLTKALSWYLGFKWILPENKTIEGLFKKGSIQPYRIRGRLYTEDRRNFLKGIIHAGLC